MVESQHFDMAVIGTGPGGEGAIMCAAKGGKSVVGVERFSQVGGGCTHWATIPSKALRQAIYHMNLCRASLPRGNETVSKLSFPELLATANSVISKQVELRSGFYERNGVPIIPGSASSSTRTRSRSITRVRPRGTSRPTRS